MNSKLILMATCLTLPILFGGAAQAQQGTSNPACELGIRHLSDEIPTIANEQVRMDVKKMHDEAVIAQKANDAKGCNDKLAQAMQRAKIGTASMTMGTFSAMDKNNDGMIRRDAYMSYRGTL